MKVTRLLLATVVAGSLGACQRGGGWQEREIDPAQVSGLLRIDAEHMTLRHDVVGHDQWASRATFVLIDVHSTHTEDLLITLGGELVDAAGAAVSPLRAESLRIPAGGVRTFALIDHQNAERQQATGAQVRVLGAHAPSYIPTVQITDGKVYPDGDRVVANGMVHNAVDRPVRVIIIAGFYDREGKPLTRPFTDMYLPGDGEHPAQFVGPPGSVAGYIFVGDMVY